MNAVLTCLMLVTGQLTPEAFQLFRPVAAQPATAINWETNYEAAQKAAFMGVKPMVLKFKMEGCAPCLRMEATTLSDASVISTIAKDFIPVVGEARAFNVDRFPTYIVLSPTGAELGRQVGYMDTAKFLQFLAAATQPRADRPLTYDEAVAQVRARKAKGAVVCKACSDDVVTRKKAEAEAEGFVFCVAPATDNRFRIGTTRYVLTQPGNTNQATATHTPPEPQAQPPISYVPPQFFLPPPTFFRGGGGSC